MNSELTPVLLGEVATIEMGQSPPGDSYNDKGDGVPLLNGPTEFGERHPVATQFTTQPTRMSRPGDILFCVRGSTTGRMNLANRDYCLGRGVAAIRGETPADTAFIFATLRNGLPSLLAIVSGSTFPNLSGADIRGFPLRWPERGERRRIAGVLGALDDKIEHNRHLARSLYRYAELLYREALTAGVQTLKAGEVVRFHNRERIPLSAQQRADMKGSYPYYGATGVFDYVNKFIFDGVFVLVGEDGSVLKPDGSPFTQYVWGQLWVNNHAHVLTGDGISTELAYLTLTIADVRAYVTGAVQAKLSMTQLKDVQVVIPARVDELESRVKMIFRLIRALTDEEGTLKLIRDALLPKLVDGRICVLYNYNPDEALGTVSEITRGGVP